MKSAQTSHISKGGKAAAGGNPSPAVYCTATAVASCPGKPIRMGDCKAAAASCWVGIPVTGVHWGATAVTGCAGKDWRAAAVTGCAGKGAVGGPRRGSVL